jgi:hypothetical protein
VLVDVPVVMELSEYKRLVYKGKRPGMPTLKNWIKKGVLKGHKKGGMYFVDLEKELGTDDALFRAVLADTA